MAASAVTMNWTPLVSLTVLWATWLVCGSHKPVRQAEKGSLGVRKEPVAYRSSIRRSASTQPRLGKVPRRRVNLPGGYWQRPLVKRDSLEPKNPAASSSKNKPQVRIRTGEIKIWQMKRPKLEMIKDEGTSAAVQSRVLRFSSGSTSPNILASFAGKNRVWIISVPHASDGYYRLMVSLLKDDVYCELAERHVQQIILFHGEGEEGGKVRKISPEGKILEQPLDPSLIPKLMSFLKLEKGKFGMVLLKKTLQVEERYPYPVRLEAIYEVIDQSPIRKIEKARQKGFIQKCKAAGGEGQIIKEGLSGGNSTRAAPSGGRVPPFPRKEETRKGKMQPTRVKTVKKVTAAAVTSPSPTTSRATAFPPTTTTLRPVARITTIPNRPSTPITTTPTTQRTWTTKSLTELPTEPETTIAPEAETSLSIWRENRRGKNPGHTQRQPTATKRPRKASHYDTYTEMPRATSEHYTRANAGRFRDNRTDKDSRDSGITAGQQKPPKSKQPKKKAQDKILSNEYEGKYDLGQPAIPHLEESIPTGNIPPKKAKESKKRIPLNKSDKKKERYEKKIERQAKKDRAERKGKQEKERNKKNKKGSKTEKDGSLKPHTKSFTQTSKKSVTNLLNFFEGKRRLLLITTPKADNNMYMQQRDEYLESFCKMATRKISIITIFGTMNNSHMKIDHFQLDNENPMKVIEDEDLVDQNLINELRREYGMTYNDFFMVLTDSDMKAKQYYEVPIAMKSVFDLIDTFQSRIKEMEKQKREGIVCKENKKQSLENFLSRFRWRRRLLVMSSPSLRHIIILKLLGVGEEIGGVLELYPINGSSSVDREDVPVHLVKDIRNYFQISPEYFSMLLVGKDGNVKSWYPSPMWSMVIVYDLIDSMQLRRQEMAIQQSLGMRCPEDEYAEYGYHGYHQGYQEGYQDDYHHHESYHHGYPYRK
ncbi:hypothetical protein E2320_005321 [Naja naja]|nr:hypothetical protein E2320_005321 [Naja naja]